MLWHGLRWFALHLHPWRPQRGPRDFYHGLLDQFSDKISSLRSRVVSNTKESYALAAQRDALLPKLVSGEVRTPHGAYGTVKGS